MGCEQPINEWNRSSSDFLADMLLPTFRKNMVTNHVARIEDAERFYEDYYLSGQPVVIAGAAMKMGAYTRWTDDYLRAVLAGVKAIVRFGNGRSGRISIEAFLAYLAAPEQFSSSYGSMYLTDFYLRPGFGDARRDTLAADAAFPLPRGVATAEWISLYAGPAGTSTAWHQDIFSTHTWLAQLRGEKQWRLCPPDGELSEPPSDNSEIYEAVLTSGDLIYLPPNWWHEVNNRTGTLSVSGNFCSFAEAEAALTEARESEAPGREVWVKTWIEILAQRPENRL
jgi:hypothetical protein